MTEVYMQGLLRLSPAEWAQEIAKKYFARFKTLRFKGAVPSDHQQRVLELEKSLQSEAGNDYSVQITFDMRSRKTKVFIANQASSVRSIGTGTSTYVQHIRRPIFSIEHSARSGEFTFNDPTGEWMITWI